MTFCRSFIAGTVWSLLFCTVALALPADRTLSQLHHTHWTAQDEAPVGIERIVQTRDGYIWLVAGGQLFRFDGVEFTRFAGMEGSPLHTDKVYAIWAHPAGGLWVSYTYGGATFINAGRVENYSTREGLPPNSVTRFSHDDAGNMWAGTTTGLMRLQAGQWSVASSAWDLPEVHVDDLRLDRDGTLWVLNSEGLFFLRAGGRRFEMALPAKRSHAEGATLITSPDGACWLVQPMLGLTELRAPPSGKPLRTHWRKRGFKSGESAVTLIDRDWNLWIASAKGVSRIRLNRDEPVQRESDCSSADVGEQISLVGDSPVDMLEDHEGNIWIVSNCGVDKFRSAAFAKLPLRSASHQAAFAVAEDGSLWIGTGAGNLYRFEGGIQRESLNTPVATLEALHRDSKGTLWFGDSRASLWHRQGDQWIEWRRDATTRGTGIQAIASEPGGALWVSTVRAGVYRVVENRCISQGGRAGLPSEPATTLAFDPTGRLWLGYINSRVGVIHRDSVTLYTAADGLSTGAVQVTAVRGRNVWIGGVRGLNWFDGRRFHDLQGANQHTFTDVNGIIETAHGDVWLNTREGAAHIPAAEVRRFVANPHHPVQFRLYNYLDGMPGAAPRIRPLPTAAETPDGRIWLSSIGGVVSLLPAQLPSNPIVPNVYIKSITVDGRSMDVMNASQLQLPPHPRDVQIAYTALSFSVPERMKFKYHLEGTNMGWQDVGTRREAYFTELPPGKYRFHVIASNDAGLWNETGATLEFSIPPTFLQSRQFFVLCGVTVIGVLWLLFVLRMRQINAHLQSRSDERLLERERIARELHDTFLQGVQGLMLRFQSAAERIPSDEPARQLMEDALERADRVLAEGRDRVSQLRASISLSLPESLTMMGNELSHDHAILFHAEVEGTTRKLNPLVQDEAYRIAAEALTNAFRHSRATRIRIVVQFGRRCLGIRVVDDGCGFDISNVKPGRWGMKGMRERAARIRARIDISSKPYSGTTVELQVPAGVAYRSTRGKRRRWLQRLLGVAKESQV